MTQYELMFIIDPALDEEKRTGVIDTVKEIIETEGTVDGVNEWGLRKLAYPIQKKNDGYYVVVNFKAERTLPKELDRRLRISDMVMRHLIVNKDEE